MIVINAIARAKNQGVCFGENTPSFRPEYTSQKERFHITILTNTSSNTSGQASIDQHFDVLNDYNETALANILIDIFNALNITEKAERIK